MKTTRRKLIIFAGSLTILTLVGYRKIKHVFQVGKIPGSITGASFSRGHLVRDPQFTGEILEESLNILIIGAGVSGLSAAYHLNERGVKGFKVLDLEPRVGGNSSSQENKAGKYPLGAHYVPLASSDSMELKIFFKKIGIITNDDLNLPEYNEYHVCSAPQERLFLGGRWQEGLEPSEGISENSKKEFFRFFDHMDKFKKLRGADGLRAFAIPINRSSQDSKYLKFDQLTMQEYLTTEGFKDKYLFWYVNYCCRDDFGASIDKVSAWAAIHYFAARDGVGVNLKSSDVITWPEGNAWLIQKFSEKIKGSIQLNTLVYDVQKINESYLVKTYNFNSKKRIFYTVAKIVYAAPLFTAKKIINIKKIQKHLKKLKLNYAPWMTANIFLKEPLEEKEIPLCWDNVNYHGKSLGYINNNHQDLSTSKRSINLTQYWPLMDSSPKKARINALTKSHPEWCNDVINEMELTHSDIRDKLEQIDISLWGHAMAIPQVGFLKRSYNLSSIDNIYFAHTDHSGISLFEEGFYQGFYAAENIFKEQV
ncbi:MAG: NAD(P)-binding protein [Halobacteriovoraceae bacterium]|jgi:hypothetical protein|nr:NAD(P)-binding protein [Halobacteriovoraceae bacterium]